MEFNKLINIELTVDGEPTTKWVYINKKLAGRFERIEIGKYCFFPASGYGFTLELLTRLTIIGEKLNAGDVNLSKG